MLTDLTSLSLQSSGSSNQHVKDEYGIRMMEVDYGNANRDAPQGGAGPSGTSTINHQPSVQSPTSVPNSQVLLSCFILIIVLILYVSLCRPILTLF